MESQQHHLYLDYVGRYYIPSIPSVSENTNRYPSPKDSPDRARDISRTVPSPFHQADITELYESIVARVIHSQAEIPRSSLRFASAGCRTQVSIRGLCTR